MNSSSGGERAAFTALEDVTAADMRIIPEIGAAILRPFVTESHHWMVLNHAVFQGYYYFHHAGLDRHARERFRGSPHFDLTADFCERFDQAAFDPRYDSLPLEAFVPLVRQVFDKPRTSTYHAPPPA